MQSSYHLFSVDISLLQPGCTLASACNRQRLEVESFECQIWIDYTESGPAWSYPLTPIDNMWKIHSYSLQNIWQWKCCLRQICWWSCVGDKHISRYNTHSHGHWHLGPSMSSLSNPSIPCLPSPTTPPTIASLCAVCKGGIIIWVHWAVHTECKIFESTLRFLICRRRLRCEDLVLLYLNSWKAFCVFVLWIVNFQFSSKHSHLYKHCGTMGGSSYGKEYVCNCVFNLLQYFLQYCRWLLSVRGVLSVEGVIYQALCWPPSPPGSSNPQTPPKHPPRLPVDPLSPSPVS